MSTDLEKTAQHWDEHVSSLSSGDTGLFWWEIPEIMRWINRKISGEPEEDWAAYTLRKHLVGRLPVERCLSLGCGAGQLERSLAALGAFCDCDAVDIANGSIQRAREAAERAGYRNIHYRLADINHIELPTAYYDIVWAYGALHHFSRLEHISRELRRSLKPTGILAIHEYVGPARFQFPSRQKEIADACLRLLPERYRVLSPAARRREARQATLVAEQGLLSALKRVFRVGSPAPPPPTSDSPGSRLLTRVGFPSLEDVVAADPSEAIRSDQILPVLQQDFEILEQVKWGGNIIQFLFAGIAGNFPDDDPEAQALVRMVLRIEETLLACGEFQSDFAYVVLGPKSRHRNEE